MCALFKAYRQKIQFFSNFVLNKADPHELAISFRRRSLVLPNDLPLASNIGYEPQGHNRTLKDLCVTICTTLKFLFKCLLLPNVTLSLPTALNQIFLQQMLQDNFSTRFINFYGLFSQKAPLFCLLRALYNIKQNQSKSTRLQLFPRKISEAVVAIATKFDGKMKTVDAHEYSDYIILRWGSVFFSHQIKPRGCQ